MYPYRRFSLEYFATHVSGPSPEFITITDIYKALGISAENTAYDPDDLLEKSVAARIEAEGILGYKLGPQVWNIVTDFWPYRWRLPLQPVSSIIDIHWIDSAGVEHVVDPSVYAFYPPINQLFLKPGFFWPDGELLPAGAIRIQVNVGIALLQIGKNVKQAILLRTGTFANIREDMTVGTVQQAAKVGTFEALLGATRDLTI